jgi:hypothetical protein
MQVAVMSNSPAIDCDAKPVARTVYRVGPSAVDNALMPAIRSSFIDASQSCSKHHLELGLPTSPALDAMRVNRVPLIQLQFDTAPLLRRGDPFQSDPIEVTL